MSRREPIPPRVSGRTPSWALAPPNGTALFFFWAPRRRSNKAPALAGGCEQRANCTAFWRFVFFNHSCKAFPLERRMRKKRSENFRISRRKNVIFFLFFFQQKNTDAMKTTTVSWLLTCCLFVSVLGFSPAMRTLCCRWVFFLLLNVRTTVA